MSFVSYQCDIRFSIYGYLYFTFMLMLKKLINEKQVIKTQKSNID